MSGCSLLYWSNHLEYMGYGKLAPAALTSVAAMAAAAPKPIVSAHIAAARVRFSCRAIVLVPPSVLAIFMLQISYNCGKSCQYVMAGALPGSVYRRLNHTVS